MLKLFFALTHSQLHWAWPKREGLKLDVFRVKMCREIHLFFEKYFLNIMEIPKLQKPCYLCRHFNHNRIFLSNLFCFYVRLYQLSKQGKLTVAAMNVNDSVTKVSFSLFVYFLKYFSFWHSKSLSKSWCQKTIFCDQLRLSFLFADKV